MINALPLPKSLAKHLEKISAENRVKPEAIASQAIAEYLDYPEWKNQAIAAGQTDLDAGRIMTTEQMLAALHTHRANRAKKTRKAA